MTLHAPALNGTYAQGEPLEAHTLCWQMGWIAPSPSRVNCKDCRRLKDLVRSRDYDGG